MMTKILHVYKRLELRLMRFHLSQKLTLGRKLIPNRSYARLRNILKIHHQASFARPSFIRDVFTWVFFSSLLLWELVHDKT